MSAMDSKIDRYRETIIRVLSKYKDLMTRHPQPHKEIFCAFDQEKDHYFLHTIGWDDMQRIWNTGVYVRLNNNKFYIEIDCTEEGIATDLLESNIPKEDIVLAFHHPSVRSYTEFAVV